MNRRNLQKAMDTRLSGLRMPPAATENVRRHMEGEKIVKRKVSLGLVLTFLLLMAGGAAIALTNSGLLFHMFGRQQIPKEVEDIISRPKVTATTPDLKFVLDEYLFDGEKLHLHWSLTSLTDRQIMVTMDPFIVQGKQIQEESVTPLQTTVHGWGQILGGEAGGVPMPKSADYYGIYISQYETVPSEYISFQKDDTLTFTSSVYVWELLNPPNLAIPEMEQILEGFLDVNALRGMPANRTGACGLAWLMLNDNTIDIYDAEKNQRTYEENGWARMLYEQPVEFTINLDAKGIKQVKPSQTTFKTDNFSLEIHRMAFMPTGGTLVLRAWPKPMNTNFMENSTLKCDFAVLDADNKELLSKHTSMTDWSGYFVDYNIILKPVSGNMPKAILLVPMVANPAWDQDRTNIYPDASSLDSNDNYYTFVMEDAVRVELE